MLKEEKRRFADSMPPYICTCENENCYPEKEAVEN